MYRFRRSKTWLSLWLIIVVLSHFGLSHHEASALVLCLGADGHVAVEPANHEHASPSPNEASLAKVGVPTHGLKAGESSCLDLPVISGSHGAHKPLSGLQKPLLAEGFAAAVLVIAIILFPITIAKLALPPDPPVVDIRLVALRSVVLLN